MTKINTVLVDDEEEALDSLEILLSEYSQINIVRKISNPIDLFPLLLTDCPDLIFLDIKMPLINGIELLEKIRECKPSLAVIIVTAYENYTMDAIKHNAFSYLLKPVNRLELKSTVEKVQKYLEDNVPIVTRKVLINASNKIIVLNPEQVALLKADGGYTYIFVNNGDVHFVSINIGSLQLKFPASHFIRISRSIIVNKDYITSVNRKHKSCTLKVDHKEITVNASSGFLTEINSIFDND